MVDGLVNFLDCLFELFACKSIVPAELVLEIKQLVLEVGHVDALTSCDSEFLPKLESLLRSLHEQGDYWDKVLRTHHIHLLISRSYYYAFVVQVIVHLQH